VGAIRLIETAASLPVPIGRRSVGARVPRFAAAGRGCHPRAWHRPARDDGSTRSRVLSEAATAGSVDRDAIGRALAPVPA